MTIDPGTVVFVGALSGVCGSIGVWRALGSTRYADRPPADIRRARRNAIGFMWVLAIIWVVVVLLVTQ
jgi:hypothetical protein